MPLTPSPDFDVNPFLNAFENSIGICNGFNMLQTVNMPPLALISSNKASVTTTPSSSTALATKTLVVPAILPKKQLP